MSNQVLSNAETLVHKDNESLSPAMTTQQSTDTTVLKPNVSTHQEIKGKAQQTAPVPRKSSGQERKRPQSRAKFVDSDQDQAPGEDSLNKLLSDAKRYGFTHKVEQNPVQETGSIKDAQGNTQSKVITDDRLNPSRLEQVIGSWYYDLAHGGFAIDSTMAAILDIDQFNGFLDQDFIFQYFDELKRSHIKHYMDSPLLGDLIFRNVTLIKGINAGKRFTFQGQILHRNSLGQTVKAVGSFAYENSPYAEFLTREIANDGLFIWDRKQKRVMSNTAYHQQLEYTEDEFPNTLSDLMGLLHPDDNDILSLQGHILSHPQYGDSYECCTRLRKSDKNYIWTTVRTLVTERNSEGEATKMIGAVTNIDMLQENFDNLKMLMFTDPLTGLHNRTYFHQNQLRYEDPKLFPVSVIFLDVSALKLTNDILGHNYGDFLLLKASQLLQNAVQVTLSEFKADEELVQSFIDERRALTKQTSQLGAFFRREESEHAEEATGSEHNKSTLIAFTHKDLSNVKPQSALHLDSKQGLALRDTSLFDFDSDLEQSADTQASMQADQQSSSLDQTCTQAKCQANVQAEQASQTESANQSQFTSQESNGCHTVRHNDNHIALDCLDNPEGCLLKDSDMNAKERAILELPNDFFNDLESKGVSPVSMSNGLGQTLSLESDGYSKEDNSKNSVENLAISLQGTDSDSSQLGSINAIYDQEEHNSSADDDILNIVSQVTGEKLHDKVSMSEQEARDKAIFLQSGQGLGFLDDAPQVKPRRHKPTLEDLKGKVNAEILEKREMKYPPEILRMGGDEFIVLCPNCDERKIRRLYENIFKIRDVLLANQVACPIEQRAVPLCFGIGYATVGEKGTHNDDFLQALQRADYRMQTNKEKYHDKHYELLQAYFEEKLNRRVSMRDDRRIKILSQKERNKLRQHLQD